MRFLFSTNDEEQRTSGLRRRGGEKGGGEAESGALTCEVTALLTPGSRPGLHSLRPLRGPGGVGGDGVLLGKDLHCQTLANADTRRYVGVTVAPAGTALI